MLQALSMENHITNICIQPKQYIHYSEIGVKPDQSTQIFNIPSFAVQLLFSYFTMKVVALNIFNLTWHLMAWWWQEMTFLVWTPAPHSWEHVDQADQRVLSVEVWDPEVIGPLPDKDISRIETCIKSNFTLIQVGEWGWEDYAILLTKPLKCLVEIIIFHIW